MVAPILIRKGLSIRLTGAPARDVVEAAPVSQISVTPADLKGMKPRLLVQEGQAVKRGAAILQDKRHESIFLTAPAAGTVRQVVYGARRAIERVVIDVAAADDAEVFPSFTVEACAAAKADDVVSLLCRTGLIGLLRQRPFSGIPTPGMTPKAVFVNAMSTAPHRADSVTVIKGREKEFQAGLNALKQCATKGLFLCIAKGDTALAGFKNASVQEFDGPHPSGNTSTHIHKLCPIGVGDTVWTITAANLVLIGELLLTGKVPSHQIVALGGPGVKAGQAKHYRVRIGATVGQITDGRLVDGETRIIAGDVLGGTATAPDRLIPFAESAVNVLAEDRERHFLGWIAPGFTLFSAHRTVASRWLGGASREWSLGTNKNGGDRAMVLTGLYDRFVDLDIMVDYLVRAVLANDFDEAVKLGLLSVDPEDFALPAFVCPSKMDLVGIVRKGLEDLEKEGI